MGSHSALALLEEVARGAYSLASFDEEDVGRAHKVIKKYRDQEIGLADASIVVLANRHETNDVLSLDERHFRALRGPAGKRFRLLPYDASS